MWLFPALPLIAQQGIVFTPSRCQVLLRFGCAEVIAVIPHLAVPMTDGIDADLDKRESVNDKGTIPLPAHLQCNEVGSRRLSPAPLRRGHLASLQTIRKSLLPTVPILPESLNQRP